MWIYFILMNVGGRLLYEILGSRINDVLLQLRCISKSKHYDVIYYPIDRHCILLSILRGVCLIKCSIVMLFHFSLNTKYVESKSKKVYKALERNFIFRFFDKVVFPSERLKDIAAEKAPGNCNFGVAHWGADYK